ncbi:hypothetical protein [Phytohabitans houttuyneae]|uniref:Uncharacterized protein n=1 Tax=Phytohabitans houttuyneae TaxID=1076126 RepID=A0A6V8KLJ1_9ACTN|nr:hypothetical protein [Phytohabitans houttuyneae]GFJ85983.1 hypothetical protein Phou_101630 [Phytohabitans houttuyneae]
MTTGEGLTAKARAEVTRVAIAGAVAGAALVIGALLASVTGGRGGAAAAVTVGVTVLLLAVVAALSPLFGSRGLPARAARRDGGGRARVRRLPPSRLP